MDADFPNCWQGDDLKSISGNLFLVWSCWDCSISGFWELETDKGVFSVCRTCTQCGGRKINNSDVGRSLDGEGSWPLLLWNRMLERMCWTIRKALPTAVDKIWSTSSDTFLSLFGAGYLDSVLKELQFWVELTHTNTWSGDFAGSLDDAAWIICLWFDIRTEFCTGSAW